MNGGWLLKIALTSLTFLSHNVLAADFVSTSGCKYFLLKLSDYEQVAIGARMNILNKSTGKLTDAYFLGRRANRLHYLSAGADSQKFFIDLAPDSNMYRFESIIESVKQKQPICSPLSALSCLRFLNQKNGLPTQLKEKLETESEQLLQEMIHTFSQEALQKEDLQTKALARVKNGRKRQHERVVAFFLRYQIRASVTDSVTDLMKHLNNGLPAIISSHVSAKIEFEPNLEDDWNIPRSIFDETLSVGSYLNPKWAPTNEGPHAVTAVKVIPANKLLFGKRILVLDSNNNAINIWPTTPLRFSQPKFILVYPK